MTRSVVSLPTGLEGFFWDIDSFLSSAPDVDVPALVERYGSEDKCRTYLERLRWPNGVTCPRCKATKGISRIVRRGQFDCASCGYQFSVTAGTSLHDSHLPLWKWILAVFMIGESRQGISADRLKRVLKVSYRTAWYLRNRIRRAMEDDGAHLGEDPRDAPGRPRREIRQQLAPEFVYRPNEFLLRDALLALLTPESGRV